MTSRAARLWVLGALRRPARAVAIVATLVVMTFTTIAALVAGDTLDRLFAADFRAEWGAVDVEARSADGLMNEGLARFLAAGADDAATAGAPRLLLGGVASVEGRREPDTLVLGLGAEEREFPPLQRVAGAVDVLALGPDDVIVNERLAERLDLTVGQSLSLLLAVPEVNERPAGEQRRRLRDASARRFTLNVAGIVADAGVADLHRTPNVLLRRDVLQRLSDLPGKVSVLHLAARDDSEDASDDLVDLLNSGGRRLGVVADPVKQDAIAIAEEEGGLFRSILLTLAFLVVGAASVATVNLLTTLGQERAREMAVLRAIGLQRRTARRLLVVEGTVYAALAALVGAFAGIPLGAALARALADHLASLNAGRGREQVELAVAARPGTVVVGALLVLVVAAFAARSAARLVLEPEIDDVLRGSPIRLRRRVEGLRRPVLTFGSGCFLLGTGIAAPSAGSSLVYLGLTLLLVSWWLLARRRSSDRRRTDERAAVAGLVWSLAGSTAVADFSQGVQAGFGVLTVAGLGAIGCATVLVVRRLRGVMRLVRAYAPKGPAQAALRTAGAYAEEAPLRSGTTIATVGGVLFTVAALSVLGSAQAVGADRQSGGFDVIGTSVAPLDDRAVAGAPGTASAAVMPQALLPESAYRVQKPDDGPVTGVPYPVRLAAPSPQFVEQQRFRLADALPGYDTAEEALQAVAISENRAVVDRYARPEGAQVGDDVVLDSPTGPRRFTLIAVLDTFLLDAVLVGRAPYREIVASRGDTWLFARAEPGVTRADLALSQEATGSDLGVVAKTVDRVADDVVKTNRTFTDVFSVMLLLALAVAIASMAAQLARAARERRAELAVLRAIGLRRRTLATMLAAEPVLAAAIGVVLGLGVGLGLLRLLFAIGYSDLAFVVNWPLLGVSVAGVVALIVVSCGFAAVRPGRRDPSRDLQDLG